jgi:hypothetical protein
MALSVVSPVLRKVTKRCSPFPLGVYAGISSTTKSSGALLKVALGRGVATIGAH